jgi:UDPglucose--hexose-1-phosphate uridylyltransferase
MMAEIRKDLVKNNWVAIAADMALNPHEFPINKRNIDQIGTSLFCPFCEGHESSTPAEIMAHRPNNSAANSPGWSIRVIPNKFSVFHLEGTLEKSHSGIYSNFNGVGRQEVVVETPLHNIDLHQYDYEQLRLVLNTYKERYNCLAQDQRIKYVQIYKNRGIFAGASIEHSHSQIIGLPCVPRWNSGVMDYYEKHGHCLLCSIVEQEIKSGVRLVFESEHFLLVCPYASRFSYETWIIPKEHSEHFGDISQAQVDDLVKTCLVYTGVMINSLNNPAYNLVINTAPVNVPYRPGTHWYLEIIPRLLVNNGVNIATGIYMNPVSPELAAACFRERMASII